MLPKHVRYQTAPHPDLEAVPHKQHKDYTTHNRSLSTPADDKNRLSEAKGTGLNGEWKMENGEWWCKSCGFV